MPEGTACKRPFAENLPPGAAAGRGAGRPPGAPPNLADSLAAIQVQLALQTSQMQKLANKDDLLGLKSTVDALSSDVADHTDEIGKLRREQQDDREAFTKRIE